MIYLLDSNACIDMMRKGHSSHVRARVIAHAPSDVAVCSVVVGELLTGAYYSGNPTKGLAEVRGLLTGMISFPYDDPAAEIYGIIKADLISRGLIVGGHDLMIASIALSRGCKVVTHNTIDFSRIPQLQIEDWQIP